MSKPSANFLFPKPVRYFLWVAGGLVFYAQVTIGLLSNFEIYSADGTRPVSAWITLANLTWNAPEQIYAYGPNAIIMAAPRALLIAAVGSLSFFVFASIRKRRFSGLIACLCIPFSLLATYLADMGLHRGGFGGMDAPWQPFGDNAVALGLSELEGNLGLTLPFMFYPVAFCFAFLVAFWQIGMAPDRTAVDGSNPRDTEDDKPHAGTKPSQGG
jgi:hypothetical protein